MSPSISSLKRSIDLDFAREVLTGSRPAGMASRVAALQEQTFGADAVEPESLPELDARDVDPDTFLAATRRLTRPVVIRGFMKDAPAVRRWTSAFLTERCGHVECMPTGLVDKPGTRSAFEAREPEPLARIMPRILAGEPLYMSASAEVFTAEPSMVSDLDLGRLQRRLTGTGGLFDELVNTQLFLGSQEVWTSLHNAAGGNIFVQLHGRKHWTLIDPCYTQALFPVPARPFQYCVSGMHGFEARRRAGEDPGVLARVPRFEVVLEPGDVLYNTPWFWHEVRNLDPYTLGCAVRHVPQPLRHRPGWRNQFLLTALSGYPSRRAQMVAVVLAARLLGRPLDMLALSNAGTTRRVQRSFREAQALREAEEARAV